MMNAKNSFLVIFICFGGSIPVAFLPFTTEAFSVVEPLPRQPLSITPCTSRCSCRQQRRSYSRRINHSFFAKQQPNNEEDEEELKTLSPPQSIDKEEDDISSTTTTGTNLADRVDTWLDQPFFEPESVSEKDPQWMQQLASWIQNDYETVEAVYAATFLAFMVILTQEAVRIQLYGWDHYVPFQSSSGSSSALW
jgi:hypothetical protein